MFYIGDAGMPLDTIEDAKRTTRVARDDTSTPEREG
jgi:hypothetical protein